MEKDSLFFNLYNYESYDSKDFVLLTDSKPHQYPEQRCPFCNELLDETYLYGHSKDCMMYDYPPISIWWFILPILLFIVFGYVWLKYKINEYKKKKN